MKNTLLLLLFFCCQLAQAQFKQDVALQRTQVPPAVVEAGSTMPPKIATTARYLVNRLKGQLAKINTLRQAAKAPVAETITLHAERLNEEDILVYWNSSTFGHATTYVIERRFGDPHGPFDSVGTVTGRSTDPLAQAYRLVDKNAFKGSTFYRLRDNKSTTGSSPTSLLVSGNNRGLQVSNTPSGAGTITVTLHQFKIAPRTRLYITDAYGSLVYQKKNVFFTTGHTIELTDVQLPKGTYHIEVVNHYNTGVNTLVIR